MTARKRKTPNPAPPPALRVGPLDTVGGVVRELGRLYRAARRGEVPAKDAGTLAYVLGEIRRALEGSEFERRLAALEGEIHDETAHG